MSDVTLPEPPEAREKEAKTRKNGKKNTKKRSQNRSDKAKPSENAEKLTETPQNPVFNLPVEPDQWVINPALYDETGDIIQAETFSFLSNGYPVITLPVNETNFRELLNALHIRLNEGGYTPDHWVVQKPLNEDLNPNPVMSLSKNGRILAATTLDQTTLKQMVKALNTYIITPPSAPKSIQKWWMKHKIARIFVTLATLPVFTAILYAFVWGIRN